MKTRNEKQQIITELKEKFENRSLIVLTDFQGMAVSESSSLRRALREVKAEYKVVKNTLAKIASAGTPVEKISDRFSGSTGIAFAKDDIVSAAKVLRDFIKESETLKIKGAIIEGRIAEPNDVQSLASIPSREELLSQLTFTLKHPMNSVVWTLENVIQKLLFVLENVKDTKKAA